MRKMATVRMIDSIIPIAGADAIECAIVGGWRVVIKKGDHAAGDLCVYCEIDSWIPHELAPFLSKGQEPRLFNDVKGERLRTIKLRGQISQGLLLPLAVVWSDVAVQRVNDFDWQADWNPSDVVGMDVTEKLNIQKWEAPINAQLAGLVRGNFPTSVPKTDQERIQNLTSELAQWVRDRDLWEVTEKLDGSSCTMLIDADGQFHVCSRNLDLHHDPANTFWKVAIEQQVEQKLRAAGLTNIALQGEIIGEGIQGNMYKLKSHKFFVFDVYDISRGEYLLPNARQRLVDELEIDHVPVLDYGLVLECDVNRLLTYAEGKSDLNRDAEREGVVFKSTQDQISFKAISNRFLLREK